MKKKQIIAGVIAAVLFVFIGVSNVGMNLVEKAFLSMPAMSMDTTSGAYGFPLGDFVGIVKIDGDMMDSAESSYYFSSGGYNHSATIDYIEALSEAENNVGILLYVNSGGGYTYIGDDLYLELMEYKEETGRPIYAYFDSIAASAAYYASMSADEIYANRMTTTGSIGVYSTYYDMSELYNKLGVKEIIVKSGDNKAVGSPGQVMTDEQIAIEQSQVDYMYEIFVDVVEKGRNMDRDKVYEIADGRAYDAEQALELDLIDGIARYEDYRAQVLSYFDDGTVFYDQDSNYSAFAYMFGEVLESMPKSDNQVIIDFIESKENGGAKYESIYR